MSLRDYARKRRFADTPEPADDAPIATRGKRPIFVVQLHNARARHYDFRLEADGALKSWAVPKGPSLRAGEKRLAVQVEDHPMSYVGFQGEIPEGNYGAGHVLVFDHGVWACEGDPLEGIAAGKLDFTLHGGKLRGGWKLIRTGGSSGRGGGKQWLLIKRRDRFAQDVEANDLVEVEPGPESSATAGRLRISGATRKEAKAAASRKTSTSIVSKRAPAATAAAQKRTAAEKKIAPARKRRNDSGWSKRALALDGARAKPFAIDFRPELASLRETPPAGEDWLHEVKLDGYRMLADVVDGVVKLRSRNNLDWTPDFPEIIEAITALPVSDLRLDGELVALDAAGHSDFATLQRTLQGTSNAALRYIVFDMPGIAGADISNATLVERKALLQALLEGALPELVFSTHVIGHGDEVFEATGKQGLEGIISKRVDACYTTTRATSSRSAQWVKVKHAQGDEFVVIGYTSPEGARTGFGALLMAAVDDGALRYAGRVGTGYDDKTLREVFKQLQSHRRKTATVALPDHLPHDKRDNGTVHWVEPALVAEVAYRGWGKEGLLRQASFQRLRIDKTVEDLGMAAKTNAVKTASKKTAERVPAQKTSSSSSFPRKRESKDLRLNKATSLDSRFRGNDDKGEDAVSGVRISSPDRVVFAEAGFTKGQVAEYYRAVADWILPALGNRPLSLVRCPDGAGGECFFQKHHAATLGKHVRAVSLKQKSGAEDYLYVRDIAGLLELVQMNALEFHPWGSHVDKPERPDVMVFDLDPGPGVTWKDVIAGGRDVRARLEEVGLESFVRLSGGKGLHVVAPIARGPTWDQVKDFTGAFAEAMAAQKPTAYIATMSKAKRDGKIFIDWLRNGRGATSVASWSLRARPTASVAMPLRWEELGRVRDPAMYDLRKAMKRAATLDADPWEGYAKVKQRLPKFG